MNMMSQGSDYLQGSLELHNGATVTYSRGGDSIAVTAVMGEEVAEAQDLGGFIIQTRSKDFIIQQTALKHFGKPARNDVITQVINGQTHRFIVNAESSQSSHFRDVDGYGVAWRIHTIRDQVIGN